MIHLQLVQIITACSFAVFGVVVVMNLIRKNRSLISFYILDSVLVSVVLTAVGIKEAAIGLIITGLLTFAVKAVMAPIFLWRIVKRSGAHFSASTNLNMPLTLLAIAAITVTSRALLAPHLTAVPDVMLAALLFSGIFVSLFFIVNRRGALTEIIGILALENSIVLAATFFGAAHSVALELAIAFDAAIWIIISSVFLQLLYVHFHDIENVSMTHLKE